MYCDQVNFDFENFLYKKDYHPSKKSLKLNKEFEYIYFFCNDGNSVLCPFKKYSPDYLDYLISLGIKLPKMDCSGSKKKWWGNCDEIEFAKFINSKITSTKIANENRLNPPGVTMVNSWTEISSHIKQFEYEKWIFRNPFGMAGTGSLVFNNEELNFNKELIFKLLKESPLVLAPYFYRLMDLGFIFDGEELEVTWNLNSKMGHFKGGIVFEKIESLKRYINSNLNINFEEVLELEKKIVKIYGELGNKGIIQIDSFFYEENDLVKFFPLVEVNARKSMGYFINKLKVFLTEGGVGLFLSFNSSKIINVRSFQERKESLGEFLYSTSEKLGIIPISPIDGFLNSFFISGRTLEEVDNLKNVLWNKIKAPGQPLPNAFSFKLN